jgi:hypothetical protein
VRPPPGGSVSDRLLLLCVVIVTGRLTQHCRRAMSALLLTLGSRDQALRRLPSTAPSGVNCSLRLAVCILSVPCCLWVKREHLADVCWRAIGSASATVVLIL